MKFGLGTAHPVDGVDVYNDGSTLTFDTPLVLSFGPGYAPIIRDGSEDLIGIAPVDPNIPKDNTATYLMIGGALLAIVLVMRR